MDMFSFSSVENFSSAECTSFFSSCCMMWSSCEHCKSALGSSAVVGRFLEGKVSKNLQVFFILGVTRSAKNLQDGRLVALSQVPGECHGREVLRPFPKLCLSYEAIVPNPFPMDSLQVLWFILLKQY